MFAQLIYLYHLCPWQFSFPIEVGYKVFRFTRIVEEVAPVVRLRHLRVSGRKKSPEGVLLINY
jgi:hypothetical protein